MITLNLELSFEELAALNLALKYHKEALLCKIAQLTKDVESFVEQDADKEEIHTLVEIIEYYTNRLIIVDSVNKKIRESY